jgi:phage shock protein PspC (stress-responsive transcriptional regulator)
MKKTFSITIAGVVFHIEEDGYERLRGYLTSVQQYFSAYEGSAEIIADIEGRIAEKFSDKLQKESKQSLSATDVDDLIRSMGTVADFEAIEEEEDLQTLHARQQAASAAGSTGTATAPPPVATGTATAARRLFRDTKRKLLGGVCAGLAHYFNVDSLWIRLLFLFLFLGIPASGPLFDHHNGDFTGPFSGFIFILYIALWVSLPANPNLEEDSTLKKLYRDPNHKVVGGVVAGVAAYTGWDLGLLRFLFVLSIFFFGTGILLYLILWAITPEAKTLTDRMQMQGQPITLENIETNVKRSLNAENAPENTLTRILLFPFRALAAIFGALGPLFNFLLVAFRVFAGLMLIVVGGAVVIGLFVALLALLGVSGMDNVVFDDVPLRIFADASPWLWVFGFLAFGIPALASAILGASLLAKRSLFNARLGLPMLALWIFGTVGAIAMGTGYAANFRRSATVEKVQTFPAASVAILDVEDDGDRDWNRVGLNIEGYDGPDFRLEQRYRADGPTREQAKVNAIFLTYNVTRRDSTLLFAERADLAPGAPFRDQYLNMTLKVPYGKPFRMSRAFAGWVSNSFNGDFFNDEKGDRFKIAQFVFSKQTNQLEALNSDVPILRDETSDEFNDGDANNDGFRMGRGEYARSFNDLRDFEKITIAGAFYVEVKQGEKYGVEVDGRQRDVDELAVRRDGNTLKIGYRDGFRLLGRNHRTVNVRITMPGLKGVDLAGAVNANVRGFDQPTDLEIDLTGASVATFTSLNAQTINADVVGASTLTLLGSAARLEADVSGASKLKAFNLKAMEADVEAVGASSASVYAVRKLRATATGASHVGYKGEATVDENATVGSSVDREEGNGEE